MRAHPLTDRAGRQLARRGRVCTVAFHAGSRKVTRAAGRAGTHAARANAVMRTRGARRRTRPRGGERRSPAAASYHLGREQQFSSSDVDVSRGGVHHTRLAARSGAAAVALVLRRATRHAGCMLQSAGFAQPTSGAVDRRATDTAQVAVVLDPAARHLRQRARFAAASNARCLAPLERFAARAVWSHQTGTGGGTRCPPGLAARQRLRAREKRADEDQLQHTVGACNEARPFRRGNRRPLCRSGASSDGSACAPCRAHGPRLPRCLRVG